MALPVKKVPDPCYRTNSLTDHRSNRCLSLRGRRRRGGSHQQLETVRDNFCFHCSVLILKYIYVPAVTVHTHTHTHTRTHARTNTTIGTYSEELRLRFPRGIPEVQLTVGKCNSLISSGSTELTNFNVFTVASLILTTHDIRVLFSVDVFRCV